jgi:hypothetical protein
VPRPRGTMKKTKSRRTHHEKKSPEHRVKSTGNPFRRDIHVASHVESGNATMASGGTSQTGISTAGSAPMAATRTDETVAATISDAPVATARAGAAITATKPVASMADARSSASVSFQAVALGEVANRHLFASGCRPVKSR